MRCEAFRWYRPFVSTSKVAAHPRHTDNEIVERLGLGVSLKTQVNGLNGKFDERLTEDHRHMRPAKPRELVDANATLVGHMMRQDQLDELVSATGSWIHVQEKMMDVVGSRTLGKRLFGHASTLIVNEIAERDVEAALYVLCHPRGDEPSHG